MEILKEATLEDAKEYHATSEKYLYCEAYLDMSVHQANVFTLTDKLSAKFEQLLKGISYSIENNSTLRLIVNGKETFDTVEISHSKSDGFFIKKPFTESQNESYEEHVLDIICKQALYDLNNKLT